MKIKEILNSPRFWQLFLVGVNAGIIVYQQTGNYLTAISSAIGGWLGGSVIVGTYDRKQDKQVEIAKINSQN